jgi:hypothetical protein
MRWYGHILSMNEERFAKKVLSMKVEGKCSRGRPRSRWEQLGKMSYRGKENHGKKF